MRSELREANGAACYVLDDLDDVERAAALDLGFTVDGATARRCFPAADVAPFYARFAEHAQALLDQAARRAKAPWADALLAVAERARGVEWWLTGSGALAVRGISVAPRDLDLVTSATGAIALGNAFRDHAVEPLTDSTGWIAEFFGRAFFGIRVEWVGGVLEEVDVPEPVDFGGVAAAQLETAEFCGVEIRVPPLELQLAVARRRGFADRAAAIEAALAG